jgi:hypothetical protein
MGAGQQGERGGFALPVMDAPVGMLSLAGGGDGFVCLTGVEQNTRLLG